ncbi:hypothetical protein ND486_07670 [Pseudonocardia sp. DR1-2]|uniref:hypothetical protein n=1 Tax=Pseudonocardia sp. DR1-2 TaxID=2951168 RepID=UPI002044C545|nr:hypothetical protein [Pseudonocardia sp. DR1-2]MCM3846069.1 hypothetical protein [Pseudonocardia sp. DR1-2]
MEQTQRGTVGGSSDALMSQISPDNVLEVGRALSAQIVAIRESLRSAQRTRVGPCGDDPISGVATPAFQDRFERTIATHAQHQTELEEAVRRLRATAVVFELGEDAIARSFAI